MAKLWHSYSSHPGDKDGRSEADKDVTAAAKMLTDAGKGKTHYAKAEKKVGDWQVNIYER